MITIFVFLLAYSNCIVCAYVCMVLISSAILQAYAFIFPTINTDFIIIIIK